MKIKLFNNDHILFFVCNFLLYFIVFWKAGNSNYTINYITAKILTSNNLIVNRNTYLRNFWKAKSVSCIGSQAGSRKNCFSTSVSRLRLVGGSPCGSCGENDKIRNSGELEASRCIAFKLLNPLFDPDIIHKLPSFLPMTIGTVNYLLK